MAGPGGGPPRRSHTKSRKGCDACKRRHIRCDENFPQCRNCTKHKIRCPYNDIPVPEDRAATPDKPDLMWTPEIEASIDQWRRTGVFPFPALGIYPTPNPQMLSIEDLRLIYHVASISHQLGTIDANGFTLWTRQIPTLIRISATHKYVLHALLAFSAMHIAFLTDCPLVGNLAYVHRGAALSGLQDAISLFSPQTSDAILAASLVLSWQATDWRSWTQLMQGTRSVIDAMDEWKHESQFGDFIAESSTFPTAPPSPIPDQKPNQPSKGDLDAFQKTLHQLQSVELHLKQNREDTKSITQLISFLKGARKVSPTLSTPQQFERLRPLRTWLFWLPVMYLQQTSGSPSALVIIAHYYTVALLMERLFPEIGAAYFGSLTLGPVEEVARRLMSMNVSGNMGPDAQTPLALMEFPIDTVADFRARMGWIQPPRTHSFPQFDPPNFYAPEQTPVPMTATPEYIPYGQNPAFSYSTEDLSMVAPDSAPNTAVSPLQLSSPFPSQQYLNIPSPSYGGGFSPGGYSPASSTFGDFNDTSSLAYSDNEDFGALDVGIPGNPMMGGHGDYGLGTPTPTYPPSEDPAHLLSSSVPPQTSAPPFLHPLYQHAGLSQPDLTAVPWLHTSAAHHRNNLSISSAPSAFEPNDTTADTPPRIGQQ